jgi:hypothetical protein
MKGEPPKMKNLIHGVLVVSVLSGSALLSAQNAPAGQAAPSAQAPASAPAAATPPAAAPSLPAVDEIVSKHVDAIGGKDAIGKVKTVVTESTFSMMGADNPSTTTIVDGVGYKSELEFNGTKMVQCYTDKGGWMINPMAGATTATAMPDDVYNTGKGQINVADALVDYAARGSKVELTGKDGNAYKIKLTTKEKVESTFLVDSTSYLITSVATKGKMQDQEVDVTTKLSDYRKTDAGLMMPYAIDVDLGGQFQIAIAVKKVELNKTIDPAVFEMPK